MHRRLLLKNLSWLPFAPVAGTCFETNSSLLYDNGVSEDSSPFDSIHELATGVFFAQGKVGFFKNGNYAEAACNNGWIIFDAFVLVIDANFPSTAASLLQEIRKTTDKPIKYVFNTHHHGDHLYGNSFWAKNGATPLAHVGVLAELRRYETGYYGNAPGRWESTASKRTDLHSYPLFPPQITFTDKIIIEDKTRRLELRHLGAGHTMGDGVAWLAKERILFAGDSCLNGPYNLFRDADIISWIAALENMQQLQPGVLVPGHGPLGDFTTIKNQQQYFKELYNWVQEKKADGVDADTLKSKLPELRAIIQQNPKTKTYLIPQPEVAAGFSLEAQTQKIFETI